MKNSSTLITKLSIIILMLLPVTIGYTNPCAVGTLRYSVLAEQPESVLSVAFNPQHNDILAVGRSDGTIRLWNTSTREVLHTLGGRTGTVEGHTDVIFTLAFSPDGNILASGSADGTVRLWHTTDIENQASIEALQEPFTGHTDIVLSLAFSATGNTLASGSRDGSIWLWNLSDLDEIEQQNVSPGGTFPAVRSLAFSPIESPTMLATARADNIIRVWNLETGKLMHAFSGHEDQVTSLAFNFDGNLLASGSADNTVKLWDTSTNTSTDKSLHEFIKHGDWVNSVAFHETTLARAGFDSAIFLSNVNTKKQLHQLTGHNGSVESIAFSSDGNTLASGGHDGKVLLWELTPTQIVADVNGDKKVNIDDLETVDSRLGMTGQNTADVNSDDIVNIADLVLVSYAIFCPTAAAAPAAYKRARALLTAEQVQQWLTEARLLEVTSPTYQRGILALEQLLAMLTPKQTSLLANYPNPFNPETWIPYQLAADANVTVSIYAVDGKLVRTFELGHQAAGNYQTKHRAAYWDGRNNFGERVASGVYFYTLTAGNFTATRKMLIRQ